MCQNRAIRERLIRPALAAGAITICVLASQASAQGASPSTGQADPAIEQLAAAWRDFAKAPPGSRQAGEARAKVGQLVQQLPAASRCRAMAAMMNVLTEPDGNLNLAAIAVFGQDPLDPNAVASLLAKDKHTAGETHLLAAYCALLNKEFARKPFSADHQAALLALLGERMIALKGKELPIAEQDLLIDLCRQAIKNATKADKPTEQALALKKAFDVFYNTAPAGPLEASVKDWRRIINPTEDLSWAEQQILMLGHWDEAKQSAAALALGRSAAAGRETLEALEKLLEDPRSTVRSNAAIAFRFSTDPLGESVAEKLVKMLKADRSGPARREAAFALAAHAGDSAAGKALPALLEIIEDLATADAALTCAWQCVQRFVPTAAGEQRQRVLRAAIAQLDKRGVAVLEVLKTLGPDAAPASEALKKYRAAASYAERELIDGILRQFQPSSAPTRPASRPQT